jgi:hypothetical protein
LKISLKKLIYPSENQFNFFFLKKKKKKKLGVAKATWDCPATPKCSPIFIFYFFLKKNDFLRNFFERIGLHRKIKKLYSALQVLSL